MKKVKCITLLFIVLAILLLIPNVSNAAITEYTYSDSEQGIEWSYELDDSGNIINLKCKTTSKTGTVTIPSTIEGKNVISLKGDYSDGAFQDCAGITGITIPNTITTIGGNAFYNCTGLKTVTIPDSVTSIGSYGFSKCSGMTSVTLSQNLTSIGSNAFSNCTGLKSVTIPNSVTTIGVCAFMGCSGLKELTLSENLTKVTDRAFYGCSGLTSVILPNSVTTIEGEYSNIYGAFGDCKNLSKVLIPDTVASIGVGAFQGCDKLTIYGNDGMTSKEYAEENGINFKYISEWDDADVGDDITPPTVENLYVDYSSVSGYPSESNFCYVSTGKSITIEFEFSELITGKTAPTLTLKCGTGENVEVSNGVIGGQKIVYTYTIKEGDEGIVTAVSLSGGDVTDIAGNQAQLSCPKELKIQWTGDYVYANGIATDVDGDKNPDNGDSSNDETNGGTDGNNPAGGQTDGDTSTGGTDKNDSTQNPTTDDKKDTTTAPTILPAAGINMAIISIIIGAIIVSIITIKKYNSYRDIK